MPVRPPKSPLSLSLATLAFLAAGSSVHATVTLQFSNTTTFASNWADGAGNVTSALAWGIIVDADRDGLAPSYLTAGVNYGNITVVQGGSPPQLLTDANGILTDDVLFMSPVLMTFLTANLDGRDGAHTGDNRITAIASIPYLAGFDSGDPFYLVWFDRAGAPASAPSGLPQPGEKFGIFGDPGLTLPPNGFETAYTSIFTGPDPVRQMNSAWAPEPSTLLLSALGALGLVRRRR